MHSGAPVLDQLDAGTSEMTVAQEAAWPAANTMASSAAAAVPAVRLTSTMLARSSSAVANARDVIFGEEAQTGGTNHQN